MVASAHRDWIKTARELGVRESPEGGETEIQQQNRNKGGRKCRGTPA